jgi:hypothetical protein
MIPDTSETSVDNNFTRQYIAEDNSEHHTRRRENLKSHNLLMLFAKKRVNEMRYWHATVFLFSINKFEYVF